MKSELSMREKFLVFIAGITLLVFISFQYIISPLYRSYTEKSEEYDLLLAEKSMLDFKFINEPVTRMNYENVESIFDDIKERYPLVMPNEDIDRILTGLCLENNLSPISLNISGSVAFDGTEKTDIAHNSNTETEESKWPPAFIVVNSNMNLKGDYESLISLLDAVEKLDYLRVSRVAFSDNRNTDNSSSSNISILFEITMLNDAL